MNATLPTPCDALTARLLRPVGFDERLVGYQLEVPLAARPRVLCSLPDVLALLQLPHHRLDLGALARWCERVLDDPALARAILQIAGRHAIPEDETKAVVELVELRMLQALRRACSSDFAAPGAELEHQAQQG
jgi:hypothetical protein